MTVLLDKVEVLWSSQSVSQFVCLYVCLSVCVCQQDKQELWTPLSEAFQMDLNIMTQIARSGPVMFRYFRDVLASVAFL